MAFANLFFHVILILEQELVLAKGKGWFFKKYQSVRVTTPLIPCRRHAPGWLCLGHYATSAVVHLAQNMVFQHEMEPEIAPVQRKLMFFNFRSIFSLITSSPERSRLRFMHTGEHCLFKVCCFSTKNLTFHIPLEYQKTECACGPRKRHDLYGSRGIGLKPISISPDKNFMISFILDFISTANPDWRPAKSCHFELVSSVSYISNSQLLRFSDSQIPRLRFSDSQILRFRFPDSQTVRSQNLDSQLLRLPVSQTRFSDPQTLRLRLSDSQSLRRSDFQTPRRSDSQNIRIPDFQSGYMSGVGARSPPLGSSSSTGSIISARSSNRPWSILRRRDAMLMMWPNGKYHIYQK